MVVVEFVGAAEHEQRAGPAVAAHLVDADRAVDGAVAQHPAAGPDLVRHREHAEIAAEEVLGHVPEDQPADPRMQAVGSHHQVEPARRAVGEGDLHAALGVRQPGYGVAEHVLDVVAGGAVEHVHQVASEDLDVAGRHTGDQRRHVDVHRAASRPDQ
jgi:hypothetical protein